MIRKDGGTAFPMQDPQAIHAYANAATEAAKHDNVEDRDQAYIAARAEAIGGMSLRAYMAAKFCAAMVSTINSDDDYYRIGRLAQDNGVITVSEWIAKESCKQADALIAELSK